MSLNYEFAFQLGVSSLSQLWCVLFRFSTSSWPKERNDSVVCVCNPRGPGRIFLPLLFSWVSSLRRPGIPHASRAMQEQRSAGKPHKRPLSMLKDRFSAHTKHPIWPGKGENYLFPEGEKLADLLWVSTKNPQQVKRWAAIFVDSPIIPNAPRGAASAL